MKKQKLKRKYKLNKKMMIAISIVVLIILGYCLYKVVALVQNPTNTFSVEQGKIYQEEEATGYIIREETVVKGNNYKNGMVQIKTEGERVAKNEPIFRYYSSGEENLKKKIAELDSKIDEAMAGEKELFTSDIKAIEKQIEETIASLVGVNNMQTIREAKKEISNGITKKAKIAGDYSPAGSYLKKLINERKKYENQLNSGTEHLKAPISGVVSYKVDGYEEILSPSNFNNLSKETLKKLNIKTGQVVADSTESGKIINNFECYIACILNSEQAKEAKLSSSVKIRLPNNAEVLSTIEYISHEDDDTILVLKLSEQVQELVSYRKISFDIIWWSHSGKKVPISAIGKEQKGDNEIYYVVRTRAGYQDKILVKVTKQNEKYSIVENYTNAELLELGYSAEELKSRKTLTLYDEILKKPE
ncbi:MAG: hypothetical protein HFJ32_02855 [Clostridia bacterium]|nr:hypothetical protein [Clostridia bacterium]